MLHEIVVIGSLNFDLVVKADRAPHAGETLSGQDFQTIPGGKGANQAVAAAKAGGQVAMIGRIGADDFGKNLKESLTSAGVDTTSVLTDANATTGIALIIVEATGENRIVIVAGANGNVSETAVTAAKPLICQAKFLIVQMEIPLETVQYALTLAHQHGVSTVLNLAPVYPVTDDLLQRVNYLIVNESEASVLSGIQVSDLPTAKEAAAILRNRGSETIILTLGSQGALLASETEIVHVPSFAVDVVDTTAAGDTFVGNFVATLNRTGNLWESVQFANAAAALTVTKFGAQIAIPTQAEVMRFLAAQSA